MRNVKQRSFTEWLVIRIQHGEQAAFTELVQTWEKRYYLYALNRLSDTEAAKDVTQDALISISKGINKLSRPAAYPAWSFQILERRCVDWLRKNLREKDFIQQTDVLPEIEVANTDEGDLSIGQSLSTMDAKFSTVLRLHYLEALSIMEIAHILKVPTGTVKSRLYQARKIMLTLLEETR